MTDFIATTDIIPEFDAANVVELAMGSYAYNMSSRYIAHGFDNCMAYTHPNNATCIKFTNIVGRFTSTKVKTPRKYSVCIDFIPNNHQNHNNISNDNNNSDNGNNDTNDNNVENKANEHELDQENPIASIGFYCSCKSGQRITNPCAHSVAVLRYCIAIKTNKLDDITDNDYYDSIRSCISDCHKYRKWRSSNKLFCICNTADDRWKMECDLCKEQYHPECINSTQNELQHFIDHDLEWLCPHCFEDCNDDESSEESLSDESSSETSETDSSDEQETESDENGSKQSVDDVDEKTPSVEHDTDIRRRGISRRGRGGIHSRVCRGRGRGRSRGRSRSRNRGRGGRGGGRGGGRQHSSIKVLISI